MAENIHITVINKGIEKIFEAPSDMGLNLMEFLKATDHDEIEGLCGGIALCATCHIKLLESEGEITYVGDDESAILETLPEVFHNSRLSCQIKLNDKLTRLKVEII
jgi:2Fe-2S ferredoxin